VGGTGKGDRAGAGCRNPNMSLGITTLMTGAAEPGWPLLAMAFR
jgi:hypothetical protein